MLYVTFFDIQRLAFGRPKASKPKTEEITPAVEPVPHP
jgi:hypothetical protein